MMGEKKNFQQWYFIIINFSSDNKNSWVLFFFINFFLLLNEVRNEISRSRQIESDVRIEIDDSDFTDLQTVDPHIQDHPLPVAVKYGTDWKSKNRVLKMSDNRLSE